jgi:hypothetical protein
MFSVLRPHQHGGINTRRQVVGTFTSLLPHYGICLGKTPKIESITDAPAVRPYQVKNRFAPAIGGAETPPCHESIMAGLKTKQPPR